MSYKPIYRMHLSTAVILMLASSGMLGAWFYFLGIMEKVPLDSIFWVSEVVGVVGGVFAFAALGVLFLIRWACESYIEKRLRRNTISTQETI